MSNGVWFASESGGQGIWALSESTSGAPTAPTTVAGTPTGATTATLTWVDASSDETGFQVQVRTAAGPGAWGDAAGAANPTAAGVQTFAATGLTAATAYDVQVRAKGASADSAYVQSAASFTTDNPGGGGGGIPTYGDVGRADEADTAFALAFTKIIAGGRADETDTALPLALVKLLNVGMAAETDTALAPDFGPVSSGTGATAAQVWNYVLSNGLTAGETLSQAWAAARNCAGA